MLKSESQPDPLTIDQKAAVKKAKPRMSLLPFDALLLVAQVLTFGAVKYSPDSWKREPFTAQDYMDAMLRHLAKISAGEFADEETKLPHAAHLACNAIFYLWHVCCKPAAEPEPLPKTTGTVTVGFTTADKELARKLLSAGCELSECTAGARYLWREDEEGGLAFRRVDGGLFWSRSKSHWNRNTDGPFTVESLGPNGPFKIEV